MRRVRPVRARKVHLFYPLTHHNLRVQRDF